MGLGKTAQAICFLLTISDAEETAAGKAALVLCPLSVLDNWKTEFSRLGH